MGGHKIATSGSSVKSSVTVINGWKFCVQLSLLFCSALYHGRHIKRNTLTVPLLACSIPQVLSGNSYFWPALCSLAAWGTIWHSSVVPTQCIGATSAPSGALQQSVACSRATAEQQGEGGRKPFTHGFYLSGLSLGSHSFFIILKFLLCCLIRSTYCSSASNCCS